MSVKTIEGKDAVVNSEYRRIENCRSCGNKEVEDILSLGEQFIVGFNHGEPTPKVPLTLCFCSACHLVQLRHTTRPDLLWNENYGYRSGVNETMRLELGSIAYLGEKLTKLSPEDIVVDIGANDGTLLAAYTTPGITRVGYEPSRNVAKHCVETLVDKKPYTMFLEFFRKEPFLRTYQDRKAKVITAIAMFYDLDDPLTFLRDVKSILHPDGVFIVQQNYLSSMLEDNAFDNIVHEHLEYYSLNTMTDLLRRADLEVFDVVTRDINGGSFRTYIRHRGALVGGGITPAVNQMLMRENGQKLGIKHTYERFARRIKSEMSVLSGFVTGMNARGAEIYVYGASTRGNTILQAAGLDGTMIKGAAERNPAKWGLVTAGTRIPIVSEEEARKRADYFLVLPWFFAQGTSSEFVQREKDFILNGGKLIIPLPGFKIISSNDIIRT